jgi:ubiquinone/menaquinone biosynthesis C-methylase UbiE
MWAITAGALKEIYRLLKPGATAGLSDITIRPSTFATVQITTARKE